jgi:hypothetical protein
MEMELDSPEDSYIEDDADAADPEESVEEEHPSAVIITEVRY